MSPAAIGVRGTGRGSRRPGLAVVGLLVLAWCVLTQDDFLTSANLGSITLVSAPLLIAALGTTALLVSGGVDLSIGSQYALVSVGTALLVRDTGSAEAGVVFALGFGAVLGAVNGLLVVVLRVTPIIVTLATLAIYRGAAFVVSDGMSVAGLPERFVALGHVRVAGVPGAVVAAGAVFLGVWWLLVRTRSGLRLFAIGGDRHAARLAGVPIRGYVVGAFALNGALIGLVALLGTARLGSGSPVLGLQFEMSVLTAAILGGVAFTGGRGHPVGVLVAVLTLGVLGTGLIFAGLQDWNQEVAIGTLLLVGVAADQLSRRIGSWRREPEAGDPAPPLPAERAGPAPRERSDEPLLVVRSVSARHGPSTVVHDVGLEVSGGELVCLVGDNGAGKSSLVQVIGGALEPAHGEVWIGDGSLSPTPRAAHRRGVATAFQQPALCDNLSVAENLSLGAECHRRLAGVVPLLDVQAAATRAARDLAGHGLSLPEPHRRLDTLSGGERQLVALARTLRDDVRVVLLDEPTAALGTYQADRVRRLARAVADSGRAVLLVTHDIEEVFALADRVVVLQRGRTIFDGPPDRVSRLELLRMMSGRARAEAARTAEAVAGERRRIERAIHDGAQQHLVTASLVLEMAARQLEGAGVDNAHLSELIGATAETLTAAIAEIRDLARGLHPRVLTDLGLAEAVRSLIDRRTTPTTLAADGLPRLPAEVEAMGYFVVAEALTNAAKHAAGAAVAVTLRVADGGLWVRVADDGGPATIDECLGSGLRGLREQVGALGGSLEVDSGPGGTTTLVARIPVGTGAAGVG